jgi:hypothetical protein
MPYRGPMDNTIVSTRDTWKTVTNGTPNCNTLQTSANQIARLVNDAGDK